MNKKKWALLLLCILLLVGYFKLFYKSWSNDTVTANADCVIAMDVKRITNTFLWNLITTPSQWKFRSTPAKEDQVSWNDMVEVPDYVFVFHVAGHPANSWYTVLKINDPVDFEKGLGQFHFEKRNSNEYVSKQTGIEFVRNGDQLLAGNASVENKTYIRQLADELFSKKHFITKETLKKNITAASHLSAQIATNNFLEGGAIFTANFDKNSLTVNATLSPGKQFSFAESNFTFSDSSLFAMAFTQPPPALQKLLTDSVKAGISKAVNFNIDSLLLPGNSSYLLEITGMQHRIDSAISYTYDDNFNPVEKVELNNVMEPAFIFTAKGNDINSVYHYWNNSGKLEKTQAGDLFTPVPFVKSYCIKKGEKELAVISNNYRSLDIKSSVNGIFFLKICLAKIPSSLLKYLPGDLSKTIENIESLEFTAKKEKEQIILHGKFSKKKNDLPLFE